MPLPSSLKKYDIISTVSSEFRIRTPSGGIFSILTILLITYLIVTESRYNFTPHLESHVYVNSSLHSSVEIDFDITFHSLQCSLIYLDASDVNGQSQSLHLDRRHHVYKRRLDKDGNYIDGRKKTQLGGTFTHEDHVENANIISSSEGGGTDGVGESNDDEAGNNPDRCGDCYGAGEEGECCDTCEDVKRAYRRRGWTFRNDKGTVEQCKGNNREVLDDRKGEGCRVKGNVQLEASGGNFHLAPGKSIEAMADEDPTLTFQDLIAATYKEFNISHTIEKLRFGQKYPGGTYQLDGAKRIIQDGYGMYQYYVTIVPTRFSYLKGKVIDTNQYSVTEHMRHVNPGSARGLPGVFFFYEVSPLHVITQQVTNGWMRFFTGISAVVGGCFVVMSGIDAGVNDFMKKIGGGGGLGL